MDEKTKKALDAILFGMLGSEELVNRWWQCNNKAFDGKTPMNTDPEIVKEYILWHGFMSGGG
jgi:hypothetical protein